MKIDSYIDEFLKKSFYGNKALKKYATDLLKGNNANSLPRMDGYDGSTNLKDNIRDSVKATMRAKDSAISVYKDFLAFLSKKGINMKSSFPRSPSIAASSVKCTLPSICSLKTQRLKTWKINSGSVTVQLRKISAVYTGAAMTPYRSVGVRFLFRTVKGTRGNETIPKFV